jgi:hypothetical protein
MLICGCSIVAIHGLNEDLVGAWTDPKSRTLWLRDLLPKSIKVARVLAFGYDASASSFFGQSCAGKIQTHAHTLVASLQADRSLEGCDRRPIIFICHGLGGVLVKKALAYSASRTSSHVAHCYTIFVSTFAILFFGTPHNSIERANWLELESAQMPGSRPRVKKQSHLDLADERDTETLRSITDHFAPIMKQFHVFFFWEEIQTTLSDRLDFIVEQSSAAPIIDNTERSGIHATHSSMVKFSRTDCSSFRTVIAALNRYCQEAPGKIARRWDQALAALAQARSNEALELVGLAFDVHDDPNFHFNPLAAEGRVNKYFYPPQERTADFVGREEVFELLQGVLTASERPASDIQQKRVVIYGMGGCGKTQFCSKFAKDNQER